MSGHDISQMPCSYCHRNVSDIDAIWDESLPFHENCHKLSLSNEIKQYQKRVSLGTITLAESTRMADLQSTINLIRDSDKRPTISTKKPRSKLLARSGNPVFFSEERRKAAILANKECNERSVLIQAKIREDKLLAESYYNTCISAGKTKEIEGSDIA